MLLWIARITGLAVAALLFAMVMGDGAAPTGAEWVYLAFFPFGFAAGYLIGWRRPLFGGCVSLACMAGSAQPLIAKKREAQVMVKQPSEPKIFRIFVLGSGTVLAALYVLVFGPKLVGLIVGTAPSLPAGRQWESHAMTALFMVFMAGYALGWWTRLWGGVVIVLASVLVTLPFVVFQGSLETPVIFGSPVFAVGALYLLLHREEVRIKRFIAELQKQRETT